ncbi:MAG: hypothetical protein U0X39_02755, partial [Bacteroidales bacterium]
MKKSRLLLAIAAFLFAIQSHSQEAQKYMLPPEAIVRIVDAPQTPSVSVSPDRLNILLIERPGLITIKELSQEELRIAGLRIDPAVSGPSRQTYNTGFSLISIDGSNPRKIEGLPSVPRMGFPVWSIDGKKFAFTNRTDNSFELWVCDIQTLKARLIANGVNLVFGGSVSWLPDNKSLVFLSVDPSRGVMPVRSTVPTGPVVQQNLGTRGQAATYQDLLKDPVDEALFEYFASSRVMLWNGSTVSAIGKAGMITDVTPSPDGNYLLVTSVSKPFSYIVPYNSFPTLTSVWSISGQTVKVLLQEPLIENQPRGY